MYKEEAIKILEEWIKVAPCDRVPGKHSKLVNEAYNVLGYAGEMTNAINKLTPMCNIIVLCKEKDEITYLLEQIDADKELAKGLDKERFVVWYKEVCVICEKSGVSLIAELVGVPLVPSFVQGLSPQELYDKYIKGRKENG